MPDIHNPAVLVLLGLLFLFSVLWGLLRFLRRRSRPAPGDAAPLLPLTPLEAVLSLFIVSSLILLVPAAGPPVFMVGSLLLALILLRRHHISPLTFWGLHRCPWGRTVFDALNTWLTAWAPMTALAALSTLLLLTLHIPINLQDALQVFLKAETPWEIAHFLILAMVIAPITEEILFRGLLYPALRVRMNPHAAACLNGALFSLMHMHPPSFLSLALLGYFLSRTFETTGRLPACILAHAFFNSATCLFLLLERYG